MASKKVQLPVMGGLRKVVQVTNPASQAANPGTTIAEFANQTVSLAQLKQALGIKTTASGNTGGAAAALVPGQGLSGGGVLTGAVPIYLAAPIPVMLGEEGGQGEMGPPGQRGIDGVIGRDGVSGALGPDGAEGPEGPMGPPGPPGPSGGPPGPTGATGPAGANGASGFSIFGEDGVQGDMGPPGATGPAGTGGGTTVALPGTIADLVLWLESDDVLAAGGKVITKMRDRTPWYGGVGAIVPSAITAPSVTVDTTQLNSLNVWKFPGNSNGEMTITNGGTPILDTVTAFVVVKPALAGSSQVLIGGPSGGFEFDLSSANQFQITKSFTAVIGANAATFSTGTWYQVNVTYDSATGAWAFRVGQATGSSGTNVQAIAAPSTGIGFNPAGGVQAVQASVAAIIIYNRVLTLTEIQNVEAYLHTKWGV